MNSASNAWRLAEFFLGPSAERFRRFVLAAFGWSGLAVLAVVAAIIVWRRSDGALESESLAAPFLLASLVAVGLVVSAVLLRFGHVASRAAIVLAVVIGSSVAGALSWPHQLGHAMAVCGFMLVGLCASAWLLRGARSDSSTSFRTPREEHAPRLRDYLVEQFRVPSVRATRPATARPLSAWQTQSRAHHDETEQLRGTIRLAFAAGQRTAVTHIAFCPPLEAPPKLTLSQLSGPPARLKATHTLPHGARLEVRLEAAAKAPCSVQIAYAGQAFRDVQRTT